MKVTVHNTNQNKEDQFEFPVLMEWIRNTQGDTEKSKGNVVLFLSRKSGITLQKNSEGFIGDHGTVFYDYVPCDDKASWRKFEGVVELSN